MREYADFLPIPIHVNRSPDRANLGTPPWEEPDPEDACRAYVRRRYGEAEPLWVSTLTDGVIDLGHDTLTVPLRGFLFVPSQSVASIKEFGTVAVYIRGMAICDEDKGLLPTWARFVRAVIDCPALQPTASREAVHQDDAFAATHRVIDDQLSRGLRDLAARQPAVWRRVASGHSDVIMGWAGKEPEFFRMVADVVPLRTSRGRLTLPDYLKDSGNVVYYTTRELGSLQEKVLAEGRDVPAIDASWFAVPQFLQRYAGLHPGVDLVRLDDDLEAMLRPAPPGELTELVRLCEELGFAARAASFRPTGLPAVMTYPADAETLRDAASAMEEGEIPDGFSGLLHSYVERRREVPGQAGMLHLNAACPLIRRLASPEVASARKQAALAVVVYFARLFCGRMLDASRAAADLDIWQRSLDRLV
jgi:molecular chaperone HtpG